MSRKEGHSALRWNKETQAMETFDPNPKPVVPDLSAEQWFLESAEAAEILERVSIAGPTEGIVELLAAYARAALSRGPLHDHHAKPSEFLENYEVFEWEVKRIGSGDHVGITEFIAEAFRAARAGSLPQPLAQIERLRQALTDLVTWPGMGVRCEGQGDNCPLCRGRIALSGTAAPLPQPERPSSDDKSQLGKERG